MQKFPNEQILQLKAVTSIQPARHTRRASCLSHLKNVNNQIKTCIHRKTADTNKYLLWSHKRK
jgi:hypothetical protein